MRLTLPFFIIIISSLTISCGAEQKSNSQKEQQVDSSKFIEEVRQDSIIKNEETKAIGNIKFNISLSEFNKQKNLFMTKTKLKKHIFYKNAVMIFNKLGNYGFNDIYGLFHNDSLYYIELQGPTMDLGEYKLIIPDQCNALRTLLVDKYGAPTIENKIVKPLQIDKGYFYRWAIWQIGNKRLEIRIARTGNNFKLNFASIFTPTEQKVREEELRLEKESIKKGRELL